MRSYLPALLCLTLFLSAVRADDADDIIQKEMKKHKISGLAVEVIQEGKPVKREAFGVANLEWDIPTTPETVFEIGSMTKQFTASGIMMLVQDGKLSVDDKISQHIPNTPEIWKDIKIRHLLTHTSGLKNYTVLDGFELSRHMTQADFVKKLGVEPLEFQPGDKWHYCNSGFNLLAYIIENTSGTNYWQYLTNRIFEPMGMTNTTSRTPGNIVKHRASGYEMNKAGRYINRDYDLTDLFGAGAIISTVDDLAKWNASLDSNQLLTKETEETMWAPTHLNSGKAQDYGFGFFLAQLKGHKIVGHGGQTSGFSATIQRFPADKLAIIILTNADEDNVATVIARAIAPLYFTSNK